MNNFHKMIKEICDEKNIKYFVLSKDWIIMLEKEDKTKFISGYKFDLNNHGLGNVFDDKYATYEVLKQKNIPIIKHQILFNENNTNAYARKSNNYSLAEQFFKECSDGIVLKANEGTCGDEVYHVTDINDISDCLNKLFSKNFSISICPFLKIKTEYRLIILKNKCVLMYGKRRPIVVGDGLKTIKELLVEFNPTYFSVKLGEEKYNKVLANGEVFEYGWQFNLSKGSMPFEIADYDLRKRLLNFVSSIIEKVDIGFCSVDVVETIDNELLVMEINSGIMMKNYINIMPNGYTIAKKVYKTAIDEMFKR